MKVYSNLDDKIVELQEEVKKLKTSQILGGDNSRVYKYFITGTSNGLYKKNGIWITKELYDDPEFVPIPMSNYGIVSAIQPITDDPFALVAIEKMEVRRGGKLLTWSDYDYYQGNMGQRSQYGDYLFVSISKSGSGWGSGSVPKLGASIQLGAFPISSLSDNPSSPIYYDYKIWLRSTSIDGYKFNPQIGISLGWY